MTTFDKREAVVWDLAAVIAADFQEAGDVDVFRKLRAELDAGQYPDALIRQKMKEALDAAVAALG